MNDLWADKRRLIHASIEPLAVRMRPRTLDEFQGQQHILGPGKLLRRMLEADVITSVLFHGPPGTGKTTLAELIATHTQRHFARENAASVGVKRIRELIDEAGRRLESTGRRSILFLDEIHRFNKSQQDVLLSDVERGLITLIGATTENPMFACNSALVSRSTLFRLEPLGKDDIVALLNRAIADKDRGYGKLDLDVTDDGLDVWAVKCDGDARRALSALEVAVFSCVNARAHKEGPSGDADDLNTDSTPSDADSAMGAHDEPSTTITIDRSIAQESIQQKAVVYAATGDEHFDSISAMIKSIRGCDANAAVFWMARMLDAGEDPRYIARRLAVLASEDIGNADPRSIMVAAACWELVERIGMPEARITLAQCAIYLALAPKSNASYVAIEEALADVREGRTIPVPLFLRDGNSGTTQGVHAEKGQDANYQYSHDAKGGVTGQDYMGVEKVYYRPTFSGFERQLAERMDQIKALRHRARG
ncbi:replication-associated recombination protein A [Roseiflexus sp. AH-315-K22]|nr:replication-associated recombination protein A [Roseiflexus sp. AH-315-K22]